MRNIFLILCLIPLLVNAQQSLDNNSWTVGQDITTDNLYVSDTFKQGNIYTITFCDTVANGDSVLICTGQTGALFIYTDTAGVLDGYSGSASVPALMLVNSDGTAISNVTGNLAYDYAANSVYLKASGTSFYVRNNRNKHRRICYEFKLFHD